MLEREWATEIRRTCNDYLAGTYTRGETLSFLLRILGALRNEQDILAGVACITTDDGLRESFVAWVYSLPDREDELMVYRGRGLPAPGTLTRLKQALAGFRRSE